MGALDIVVLVVVGLFAVVGLWKGLVRQVVGLAGIAAGYLIAVRFYATLAEKVLPGFRPTIGHVISFLSIFVACILAASVLGWIVGRLVNIVHLRIVNRIAGGLLGGIKGYLIVAILTMVLVAILPLDSGVLKGSRTMKYIRPMATLICKVAPQSIRMKYERKTADAGRLPDKSGSK